MNLSTDAIVWLKFAKADLRAAEILSFDDEVPNRLACFHAQQAAEKCLKAMLIASQVPFRKTHDLMILVGLLGEPVRSQIELLDVLILQVWAVDGRYPGDLPEATEMEASQALEVAGRIVEIIQTELGAPNSR